MDHEVTLVDSRDEQDQLTILGLVDGGLLPEQLAGSARTRGEVRTIPILSESQFGMVMAIASSARPVRMLWVARRAIVFSCMVDSARGPIGWIRCRNDQSR